LAPSIRQPFPPRSACVGRPLPQNQPASRVTTAAKTGVSDWKAARCRSRWASVPWVATALAKPSARERDSQRRVAVRDFIERNRVQDRRLIHRFGGRRALRQSKFPGPAKQSFRKFAGLVGGARGRTSLVGGELPRRGLDEGLLFRKRKRDHGVPTSTVR
jgi:hypothetical protein